MSTDLSHSNDSFPVIDCHVHPIRPIVTIQSIVEDMDKSGISKAVLLALDLDPDVLDNPKIRDEVVEDIFAFSLFIDPYQLIDTMKKIIQTGQTSNQAVAEFCDKHPNRFIGFGSVNPSKSKQYVKNTLREVESLGLKGLKLIPTLQFFHPKKNKNLKHVFKFATKRNWPILIHTGRDPGPFEIRTLRYVKGSHPSQWTKFVKKSKSPIIFAHLGGYGVQSDESWLDSALELAEENSNIYLDTSAVTYALQNTTIVSKIRKIGFQQILFGSDSPVVLGTSMEHSKQVILKSSLLSGEEKRMVLYQNAERLFKNLH
jgi:predicted TIM-barrel fold metal-dependent hydrolase